MSVLGAIAVPHPPLILPEVGRGEEKKIQKTIDSYHTAMMRLAELRPDTVVLLSPHAVMYADWFHISPGVRAWGDLSQFGVPGVRVEASYDAEFTQALSRLCAEKDVPAGTQGERNASLDHASVIPLRFLGETGLTCRIVRIGLSGLPPVTHYALGKCIAEVSETLSRRTAIIASGDLSHRLAEDGPYGFAPEGPVFDRLVTEALAAGDFGALLHLSPAFCDAAGECGLRAFQIMAGTLDGKNVRSELLSYEGPFGVGYATAVFLPAGEDAGRQFGAALEAEEAAMLARSKAKEDPYVRLARLSLETYVRTGKRAEMPDQLPPELLTQRAGAFVSLKKDGLLRGCIGTFAPTESILAKEILRNAVSAGTEDPRFPPVTAAELPKLVYSVDVLTAPEPVSSETELDPKKYGVIVSRGTRRGLLLPDLEGVDTVEEQIAICRQKAGIGLREDVELSRFQAVRHL